MKERPIIFNTEMVRAILDGRKTQTRRVIKPQPEEEIKKHYPDFDGQVYMPDVITNDRKKIFAFCTAPEIKAGEIVGSMKSKYGEPGDRLYVREAFAPKYFDDGKPAWRANWSEAAADVVPEPKWKPSIHMPKDIARIWLKVKDVRVERIQDISYADICREGISFQKRPVFAAVEFEKLWNSINADRGYSWEYNPWVWVVEFDIETMPEDD